ncbi:probable LRR receptor-like serine/threonine-protein kinase At3g47570 [Solanum lycopersicum]|uniref:probable LRR receptor-like serine/threonine-protein kinase At3g47570 n=1 Tax=Solanum lycopersicum TaxID=4081 RepID=UPI0002767CE6|nr:LRR receptor-like serine/threonine-protein kinase EFR [Solanum lycopersicum]
MGRSCDLLFALAVFVLIIFGHTSLSTVPNISTDEAALLALKSHISFSSNNILATNWSSSSPVCTWIGITCNSRHHRVTTLDISSMQLHGTIPPHLGNLSFLVSIIIDNNTFHGELPKELKLISVRRNNFTGAIPTFLSLLPELRIVHLSSNQFFGEIPSSLSNITQLQVLDMSKNFLKGEIPQELGDLHHMTLFNLENNQLTGSIPPSIFNITTMKKIGLTYNNLTGKLPATICDHLPNLEELHLSANYIHGVIPPNIGKCGKLQILSLSRNELTGTVPTEIGNLTELTSLYLGTLHLEGEIPASISNMSELQNLGFARNRLSGEIPMELGYLQKLLFLSLDTNELTGSIPASIFNMSALQILGIAENRLSGTLPSDLGRGMPDLDGFYCYQNTLSGLLPASISNASRLRVLELSYNSFTGPIPESVSDLENIEVLNLGANNFVSNLALSFLTSLTNCRKLKEITFAENPLDGFLPASIGNLSDSLQIFQGWYCKLKGFIPGEIGNLTGMIKMDLSQNELIGHIPKTIQGLKKLQELSLGGNKIKGTIPDVMCNLYDLGALDLSENLASGSIPPCLGNITSLRYLYLSNNRLNWTLPSSLWSLQDLIEFNISSNLLSGEIPLEIGNLKVVTLVDLSKNDFSGKIPNTLGGLDRMLSLSLAHNKLDGPIPDSFGKMLALEFLDLTNNNLSGEIPKSLEALVYVKYLNFSFNELSGAIPTGGPFANATGQSFLSNYGLCGDSKFRVSPCVIKSPKRSKRKKIILVLYILLGVGMLFLSLALTYVFLRWRKIKKNVDQADVFLLKGKHERISYYELEQATEGFDESNLLGSGSFSKVFKGILKDGTLLAAKVFNVQLEGAFKSFDTECEMLRNLRHRNLTKVITSCSNPDFKALVLEYMPNGTLDKWLYNHNFFLDMLQRLSIMIDVASAIDYLHNGYSTPVVHCDLKPSNVLLDNEMVGHVSDFGIAKLLGAGEDFVQTRTIATIGYIAPEYGQDGIVSTSCDVYSFGIVIMEMFTRRRPSDEIFTGEMNIRCWINDSFPSGIHKVVDSNLIRPGNEQIDAKMQCFSSIMKLALSCTVVTPDARISMEDALSTLKKIRLQFFNSLR